MNLQGDSATGNASGMNFLEPLTPKTGPTGDTWMDLELDAPGFGRRGSDFGLDDFSSHQLSPDKPGASGLLLSIPGLGPSWSNIQPRALTDASPGSGPASPVSRSRTDSAAGHHMSNMVKAGFGPVSTSLSSQPLGL